MGLCLDLTFRPIDLHICFCVHIMSILLTLEHHLESGMVIPLALLIVGMGYICMYGGQKTPGTLLCQILTQPGPPSPSDHPAPLHTHTHTPWPGFKPRSYCLSHRPFYPIEPSPWAQHTFVCLSEVFYVFRCNLMLLFLFL